MFEYIMSNFAQTLIVTGLLLLSIEILILGFATFVLFYLGCGLIITGVLVAVDILPSDFLIASITLAIISGLIALLTWKPLKRLQNEVVSSTPANDMIGHRFMLPQDLDEGGSIKMSYSGIDWIVRADTAIVLGLEVEIIKVSVGELKVKPVE